MGHGADSLGGIASEAKRQRLRTLALQLLQLLEEGLSKAEEGVSKPATRLIDVSSAALSQMASTCASALLDSDGISRVVALLGAVFDANIDVARISAHAAHTIASLVSTLLTLVSSTADVSAGPARTVDAFSINKSICLRSAASIASRFHSCRTPRAGRRGSVGRAASRFDADEDRAALPRHWQRPRHAQRGGNRLAAGDTPHAARR
eukprot:2842989-Pleurochrysis_carterae.AAC.1